MLGKTMEFITGVAVGAAACGLLFYTVFEKQNTNCSSKIVHSKPKTSNDQAIHKHAGSSHKVFSASASNSREDAHKISTGADSPTKKSRFLSGCSKQTNLPVNFPVDNAGTDLEVCSRSNPVSIQYYSVGVIESCFPSCRGTPRQGYLMPGARATLWLHNDINSDTIDGLGGYSHIWVLFHFHRNKKSMKHHNSQQAKCKGKVSAKQLAGIAKRKRPRFKSKINPPKLLNGAKVGVFSARTPHRPNAIGLTLCRIEGIDRKNKQIFLSGVDLVDGTPVVDIKPYVPHYDSIPEATVPEWVQNSLSAPLLDVVIEPKAKKAMMREVEALKERDGKKQSCSRKKLPGLRIYASYPALERAVIEMLRLDINSGGTLNKLKSSTAHGANITPTRTFFTILDGLQFECHWQQGGDRVVRVVDATHA